MRRSRLIGLLLVVLLSPAVVAGAVMLRAHRLLADPGTLAKGFSVGLGRGLTFESIDVALWPPGIVIRGVELADRSNYGTGELAHVDAIWLQAGIPALVRGAVRIEEVLLEKPTLRVVLGPEGWNLGAGEQYLETPEAFDVRRVTATGLRLVYRDRTRPGVAEFEVRNASLNAVRGDVEEGWSIDLDGSTEGIAGPEVVPGFVRVQLQTPAVDEGLLRFEGSVEGLGGDRVGELAQLLGGDMPFGSQLVGALSGRVEGAVGVRGDSSETKLAVDLNLGEAELRTRDGWILKPKGLPAQARLEGSAASGGLEIDAFTGKAADLEIRATRSSGGDQLDLSGSGLAGRDLERVLPLLASIRPRGKLTLAGVVRSVTDGRQLNLELEGESLTLLPEEERWTLGKFSLALGLDASGDYALAVRVAEIAGQEFAMDGLGFGYLVRGDGMPLVDLHASGLRRGGARVDDVWLRGNIREESLVAGEILTRAFGGRSSGNGTFSRVDNIWEGVLESSWESMDINGLEEFFGVAPGVDGVISGAAELRASGDDQASFSASLSGPVRFEVADAKFLSLNPATLAADAVGRLPIVGGPLKRRVSKTGRQMANSGSDRLVLQGSARWGEQNLVLDRLRVTGSLYDFSGEGSVSSEGAVDLRGDINLRGQVAEQMRQGNARIRAVLGASGPMVLPVVLSGNYPDLIARPEESFQRELSQRARRGGRSLGNELRQQLREALEP
ncbi:MAG: AsmA-like C-terminal region-containing protein [Candidatus Binatia bacterium]|nr:AsmA-like C-terminal region-containing protein [Candidatus Binatia bacterium]MDG2009061.1 AsmA-like C-terminal region-containing protein [Candidatus Binatia bacterium]